MDWTFIASIFFYPSQTSEREQLYIRRVFQALEAVFFGMMQHAIPDKWRLNCTSLCFCRLNSDLPDLLQNCDYIINVLPSTPYTVGLLNGDMLKHCAKKQSVFMNIGRATVIKEEDLVTALNKGWLSAAILDVFETEPLPSSSSLWTMPQVQYTFPLKSQYL